MPAPSCASLDLALVESLYARFADDLRRTRARQRQLYDRVFRSPWDRGPAFRAFRKVVRSAGIPFAAEPERSAQLDDISAELTYLLVRHFRPRQIVEISPRGGWSTTWILRALEDNGDGWLHSFDLIDTATRNVPASLRSRWRFVQGDVRRTSVRLPTPIDYLFLDSDHSAAFARWYLETIMPRLRSGTPVSVDDVYHTSDDGEGEGEVVMSWLAERRVPVFTASKARAPEVMARLDALRRELGLGPRVHRSDANPTIFFLSPAHPR